MLSGNSVNTRDSDINYCNTGFSARATIRIAYEQKKNVTNKIYVALDNMKNIYANTKRKTNIIARRINNAICAHERQS